MKKADAHIQGYIAALSHMWYGHGESSMIDEGMEMIGAMDIDPSSVDQFDAVFLASYQKHGDSRVTPNKNTKGHHNETPPLP